MSEDFKLDTKEFFKAFEEIVKTHKKDAPKYLNKKALNVIIGSGGHPGAVQLTPKANLKKVTRQAIIVRVANRLRRQGKKLLKSASSKDSGGNGVTPHEFYVMVAIEMGKIKSARGYTAGPGWFPAAIKLGGTGSKTGKIDSRLATSKARKGYAKKATPAHLEALLVNAAPAAHIIGKQALQKAVDGQTQDLKEYGAKELLGKTFKKHSAR